MICSQMDHHQSLKTNSWSQVSWPTSLFNHSVTSKEAFLMETQVMGQLLPWWQVIILVELVAKQRL